MAEVTSGTNLAVIVLKQYEADALAGLLHRWANDDTIDGDPRLWELYNAMVPTDEDGYCTDCWIKLDEDEIVWVAPDGRASWADGKAYCTGCAPAEVAA